MPKPIYIGVLYNTAIAISIITISVKFEFVLLCFVYSRT